MSGYRLPTGGRIDRGRNVTFTWDGTRHVGCPGDTVASALLAHGERVLGRSFKYHRPRGVMTAGIEEGGALVTLGRGADRIPNVKATQAEIHDGLEVSGQNAWPSVSAGPDRRREQPAGPVLRRGVLLQDLLRRDRARHARVDVLRALHPPRSRHGHAQRPRRPGRVRDRQRPLRRAGRRLGPRRAGGGRRGGGGRAGRRAGRAGFRARAGRSPTGWRRPSAASRPRAGWRSGSRRWRRRACGSGRARRRSGCTTTASSGCSSASPTTWPSRGTCRASGSASCARGASCWRPAPSSGPSSLAPTTGRG